NGIYFTQKRHTFPPTCAALFHRRLQYQAYHVNANKTLREINVNIASIALEKKYNIYLNTKNEIKQYLTHGHLLKFIIDNLDTTIELPIKGVIQTKSNLNYTRFRKILMLLAIDESDFKLSKVHIDKHLVDMRNVIAHGNRKEVDEKTFMDIFDKTLELIEKFDSCLIDID
ncbi:MAG: hypothetical protein JEZ07_18365, partial [Phycisphaerae bacterium]|nr:hypothetical protein [Phycisphaerae bacterium]